MDLSDSVDKLKGVGPEVAKKLTILKIKTVWDLINYYPRRYEDYSNVTQISKIKPGQAVTLKGKIIQSNGRYVRRGMHITEAILSDSSGSVKLVWFNQPYRINALKQDKTYFVSGNFELSRSRLSIINPSAELESNFQVNTARIIPIYKETKGLKSSAIRKIISQITPYVRQIDEILPPAVVKQNNLMSRADALLNLHFPETAISLDEAKRRLSFEELFGLMVANLINKQEFAKESGVKVAFSEKLAKDFTNSLPYRLTDAQRKVIWKIYKDMESSKPMNRLVEGDVGSGKTVVAAMSALMALKAGYQVALMAPTEILAAQHYRSMTDMLKNSEFSGMVTYLVGSVPPKDKKLIKEQIKSGKKRFIVGTHALITEDVDIAELGLVIIDEQHRFGVKQRKNLQAKAQRMPHVLSMTATPIPRTLALTVYGDLDISVIDEMPPGRTPVETKIISPNSKEPVYQRVRELLDLGQQMFVVCPLIEESDKLQVLSAEKVYEDLKTKVFKDRKIGLLHGKMKQTEKDSIMRAFIDAELNILVATTVIEVGVDVPNATIMMIEGVERFGLAQIHQLRGRVGRGKQPGYCYLVMSDSKAPSRRIHALERMTDGFKLAELDLELRGPGAIYGTVQSGQIDLRIADISDVRLIELVRNSAQKFISSGGELKKYPELRRVVEQNRTVTNLN